MKTYRTHILIALLLSLLISCTDVALGGKAAPEAKKDPTLSNLPPKKPVHIKLKRNFKGEYSWDLTGDNLKDMLKLNAELQKEFSSH
ncbi:MAG: hypothetical protein SFH39_03340 [Candidatus Magnetobacterium sp. LHC-1]|uniref:Secreted protein n=1 Tax=Candidatus Magnetobacterium casense TaxID=1455061 RepID=A0ABS6S162_9BACT|nr:hypothetical protein [Candidatus Magnetobacterium casensis]MBF0609418.1 hypothetical protein [Nitrospirota bacterium]MBV6342551.1 hypothetical protein [Candidatus Magnetobacterium casensis]